MHTGSPYTDNKQHYSSILEAAAANARGWRMVSFGLLLLALLAVGGIAYIGSQSKIKPMVIEIDGYGTPMRLYEVDEATTSSDSRIMKAALANVITAVRSVSVDSGYQKRQLDNVIDFFERGSPGFVRIQDYITHPQTNPFNRAKRVIVDVQINNVFKVTNSAWQIEWTETVRDRTGTVNQVVSYKATATVTQAEEISAATVYVNPMGILIKDIVWSQQIENKSEES